MAWIQVRPKMVLKDEGLSINVKGMKSMTGPTATDNTTSPNELV